MKEDTPTRLKRLTMRSWRRGMREMDLILGPFAEKALKSFPVGDLEGYEALLSENDQEIYTWITGAQPPPAKHQKLIDKIVSSIGSD